MQRRPHPRRGFVLIVALIVVFAIASLVITLGRAARTDSQASANQAAAYEAAAIERGVEQYIQALLNQQVDVATELTEEDWAGVPLGTGYFWVIRPDYNDDDLPLYGLVDESTKLNLNAVDYETLMRLPNMTEDVAGSIIDWRDINDEITSSGAESGVYLGLPEPYRAKNEPFETVEEMLLVHRVTRELFHGEEAAAAEGTSTSLGRSLVGSDVLRRNGWKDFFTIWSTQPAPIPNAPALTGRININEAPREVLLCLPDLTESDVDALLARRPAAVATSSTDVAWAIEVLQQKAGPIGPRITGRGAQFSADILAVSGNGRAFKRVKIVIDTLVSPAQVVYRRDLTEQGFPLDLSILESLRSGRGLDGTGSSDMQIGSRGAS